MDPEQRSELEESDQYIVAYIDFDGSSDTLPNMRTGTVELLHEIKMKKYPDKHRLYLVQRIRGSTARDPVVFELLKRRMSQVVDLMKRELLPAHAAMEDKKPPPSEDEFSSQDLPLGWATWSELPIPAEPEARSLEDEVNSGSYFWYGPNIYPMSRLPRGMCVIINNCNFEDVTERCDGSVHDVRPMEALFKTFLFDCIVHTDLKADEMKKLLSEAAKSKEHEQAQCLVVILISHGNQDTILGVDGETLNLENDVYREFNNEKCAALQGKPKLFFIQACQKNESDSGASTTVAETADTMAEPAEKPQSGKYDSEASTTMADSADDMADPAAKPQSAKRVSSWSDMYIAYAVISQYDAPRDTEIAACFLSVVFKVFSQCACVVHLDDLMKAVHEEVRGKSSHGGRSHTLGGGGRGWTKTLYFNPLKYV